MTTVDASRPVFGSGTLTLGDHDPLTFRRLGFGAMQITGAGIWGDPPDRDEAVAVLRRAVELGVDFVDTADSYGPAVSEELIREALHPYDGVVVATKGGLVRGGPDQWKPFCRPDYLRQCVELSLRRLDVERIDLYQLHRIDTGVPAEDQFGVLKELQDEGKILHVGLSEVTVDQLEAARRVLPIVSVQNLYNLTNSQHSAPVLARCEAEGIAFIPWFPIATGALARPGGPLDSLATAVGATPAQLALAWLLRKSPVMVPIPGTKSQAHVEENCAAGAIELSDETMAALDALAA